MQRRNFIKYLTSFLIVSPSLVYAKPASKSNYDDTSTRFDFEKSLNGEKFEDYSPLLQKAMEICAENNQILYLSASYNITKPLIVPANLRVVGGNGASIQCLENNPITIIYAENVNNIHITGLKLDGNVTGDIDKSFKRTARFVNCKAITLEKFTVVNSADWAISFEESDSIKARSIKVSGGGRGKPGGRDGLHFLDCSNVEVDGADIVSGDDCVAITSKNKNIENITIKNVSGSSDIGSIVIYNEEQYKDKSYSHSQVSNLNISDISVKENGKARDVVRVFSYNPNTTIKNVSISNVSGDSNNHAVYLGGIEGLFLKNIDVSSHKQHGIYIVRSHDVQIDNIIGASSADKSFGISILNSSNVKGTASSRSYNKSNKILISKSNNVEITK